MWLTTILVLAWSLLHAGSSLPEISRTARELATERDKLNRARQLEVNVQARILVEQQRTLKMLEQLNHRLTVALEGE